MNATAISSRALKALQRAGTTYTLGKVAVTPETDEPWKVDSTASSTQTVTGVLDDFRAGERDGDVVKDTDRRYLIAASGLSWAPEPGHTLTDSSVAYRVQAVQEIRAAATAAAYYLHVRG
jgi:hypothetical protein